MARHKESCLWSTDWSSDTYFIRRMSQGHRDTPVARIQLLKIWGIDNYAKDGGPGKV